MRANPPVSFFFFVFFSFFVLDEVIVGGCAGRRIGTYCGWVGEWMRMDGRITLRNSLFQPTGAAALH